MNKFTRAAVLAALSAAVVFPAMASDGTVFEHSSHYVAQDIAAQGYTVSGVEEWGDLIVATVVDDQGHSSFRYFDPDTLALVR